MNLLPLTGQVFPALLKFPKNRKNAVFGFPFSPVFMRPYWKIKLVIKFNDLAVFNKKQQRLNQQNTRNLSANLCS